MSENQSFTALGLKPAIQSALDSMGFEHATPIQAETIPVLLEGRDVIGQAQTGTGKTAAFGLPILNTLEIECRAPQALIITPTRELANQVAEALSEFGAQMKGLRIATVYGGQAYHAQMQDLKKGSHIVVGTPGRIMDHMRRGTLQLGELTTLVLDEADEMLNMGFVDDIEWILEQTPDQHQTALFSATMPPAIAKIAKTYLTEPHTVKIAAKQETVDRIEQRYTCVSKGDKMETLIRFVEVEPIQAGMIFTATKLFSSEIADKLQARGHAAAALNGDMSQDARERVIERIKSGSLQFIVATDVAARGIDVDKISHVFNFDIPSDPETYTHRIGRTGRAGRSGCAISIITPREMRFIKLIQKQTRSTMELVTPPGIQALRERRDQQTQDALIEALESHKQLKPFHRMVNSIIATTAYSPEDIAAAMLYLHQRTSPIGSHEIKLADPERPERSRKRGSFSDGRKRSRSGGGFGGGRRRDGGGGGRRRAEGGEGRRRAEGGEGRRRAEGGEGRRRAEGGEGRRRKPDDSGRRGDRKRAAHA